MGTDIQSRNSWRLRLLCAAAVASLATTAGAQSDGGGKFKPAVDSSVRVVAQMPDGSSNWGTGWVISAADQVNGAGTAVVITARHVVKGAVKVTIVQADAPIDNQLPATVRTTTAERDVAFLEVKDLTQRPLTMTRAQPDIGDGVRVAGYAAASDANEAAKRATRASLKLGGFSKAFRGAITSEAQAPVDQIEFDAPILPGFSGGPVLNDCGNVIGMTVKDGGHIRIAEGAQVSVAQGVSVALSADEIVKAAHDAGVAINVVNAACGDTPAAPPPPPPPCPAPFMSEVDGKACSPKPPTSFEKVVHTVTSRNAIIVEIAAAALIAVGGTVAYLLRAPGSKSEAPGSILGQSGSIPLPGGSKPLVEPRSPTSRRLRLTGRGPTGDAIDLQFSADELVGTGITLGVEGDPGGRIPDPRPQAHVSRRHARLTFDGASFHIEDSKSANGTFVGGVRLPPSVPRALVSGDQLKLADVTLNVSID